MSGFEDSDDGVAADKKTEVEATDAYIDGILSSRGYSSGSFNTPISQFGPGLKNSSLLLMDLFTHPKFRKDMSVSLKYFRTCCNSKPCSRAFCT